MRITNAGKISAASAGALMMAAVAAGVPAGTATAATGPVTAQIATKTYRGTFQHADTCKLLRSTSGRHYLLESSRYKIGNNGGLYGPHGFIAYPNWKIKVRGKFHKHVGTTFCTTYTLYGWIAVSSITRG